MNWRSIKAAARGEIHRTFGVPVIYLTHVGGTPVHLTARVHAQVGAIDMPWPNVAGMMDSNPRIIFARSDLSQARYNAVVVVDSDEGYRLGSATPARDGYYEVEATRLTPAELAPIWASLGDEVLGIGTMAVGSTLVVA